MSYNNKKIHFYPLFKQKKLPYSIKKTSDPYQVFKTRLNKKNIRSFTDKSLSFYTVKKINISKIQPINKFSHKQLLSERKHLNSTLKKKKKNEKKPEKQNRSQSQKLGINQYNRSDYENSKFRLQNVSTPKFGQKNIKAHNLMNYKFDLLFQLENIAKKFEKNYELISLTSLKRIQVSKDNLQNCLMLNEKLLEKEWFLILKACSMVINERQNVQIERMIVKWMQKKEKINELKQNLHCAIQLLKL